MAAPNSAQLASVVSDLHQVLLCLLIQYLARLVLLLLYQLEGALRKLLFIFRLALGYPGTAQAVVTPRLHARMNIGFFCSGFC